MPLDKGFERYFGIPASMNYGVLAWFEGRFAKVPPTLYTAKKPNRVAISDYRIAPPYEATPELVKQKLGKPGMEVAEDFVDVECLQRFTDQAIRWIRDGAADVRNGRPFFVYLALTSPHKPVIPQAKFRGHGTAGAYGEFMFETDHHVGRLLAALEEQGLAENTMVIVTSDNGPENTWRQRAERFGHQSNGPFREGKRSIYEGGHRVPFVVRWPQGIVAPGRAYAGPICQTDLMATLAELLEVRLPDHAAEDSQSFLPVLRQPDADLSHRRPLVHHAANGRFAVRFHDWKLVMPHGNKPRELYDLRSDPSESRNLIDSHKAKADDLERRLTEIVRQGRTTAGSRQANDTGFWPDLAWMDPDDFATDVKTE